MDRDPTRECRAQVAALAPGGGKVGDPGGDRVGDKDRWARKRGAGKASAPDLKALVLAVWDPA